MPRSRPSASLLMACWLLQAGVLAAQERGLNPGDVYREYATHNGGNRDWRVTDPNASNPGAQQFLPNPTLTITIDDLEHAVRVEAVLDRWGGHPKTTAKSIRFNGGEWLLVPEITTTPQGRAEFYYSQDNPVIDVPLEHLREGVNTFEGTCSALDGFGWGQWGLYSLILRVYYDSDLKPHPTGRIAAPRAGETGSDNAVVTLDCSDDTTRADVVAWYDGNDEDGDGVFQEWHGSRHQRQRGAPAELMDHVGTDNEAPFEIAWDTTWVPDQDPGSVKLIARVRNQDGIWFVTDTIEGLTLDRDGRVALYAAENVPGAFGVRVGQVKSCTITIPEDAPLDRAGEAVLSLRTWHGWDGHHKPLRLNGRSFPIEGNNHHYDFDLLPVPVSVLKPGENVFEIESQTEHHMLEVLWPGPALLVRYSGAQSTAYQRHALTQPGDAANGRTLFLDEKLTKCAVCHRVNDAGGQVGPDLTSIGGKFDRPHLIEALLEPSRQIVEGYRTTVVVTAEGQVLSGVVNEQSDDGFTLVDAEDKRHAILRADVESSRTSDVSIMPANLAEALSVHEFTDLIAYLETLRPGGKPKFGEGVSGPITVPDAFEVSVVATGISGATALETLPDGRVLICEQTGALRVVEGGRMLDEPFLTLPVEAYWERGLIGVTIDPDFPRTPYVYVCRVVGDPYPHHVVSRFTADGNVADPDSEQVLLVGDDQGQMGGKVPAGHQGGALHFGPDGKLYVGIGEQTAETPSQELDTFLGKLLRINADGTIPDDNPFVDEAEGKYRAIWARGLRNPFTFAFHPQNGLLLINDVGGKFEEINVGRAGGNYGWPAVDHGPREDEEFLGPLHWYPQSSIGGGDFVLADYGWPTEYHGRYLFADFVQGWIKMLDPDAPDSVETLASGLRRPVDLRCAADGSLYVLLRNAWVLDDKFEGGTGSLIRIRPTPDPERTGVR